MKNRIFLYIFLVFISAIIFAGHVAIDFYSILVLCFAVLALAIVLSRDNIFFFSLILIAAFLLGNICFIYRESLPPNHIKNLTPENARLAVISGTVITSPQITPKRYNQEIRQKTTFAMEIERIKYDKEWLKVSGKILVNSYAHFDYQLGQALVIEGIISAPKPLSNPAGFDYKEYLARKKIFTTFSIYENMPQHIASVPDKNNVAYFAEVTQKKITAIINRFFYPPYDALFNAIIIGRRNDFDENIKDNFIKTGTMHILAISGLHVGIIGFLVFGTLKILGIKRRLRIIITMFILVIYALICQERPSVLRAVIMGELFMLGMLLMRSISLVNCLSLAGIILLAAQPQSLFDAGFVLSFGCVFAIIYLMPALEKFLNVNYTKDLRRRDRARNYIKKSLIISLSVFIGTCPVIAYYFYTVSWISILVNLIVIPASFVVLGLGFLLLVVSGVVFISDMIAAMGILSMAFILEVNKIFAAIPLSHIRVASPAPWFIAAYYLLVVVFLNYERLKLTKAKVVIIVMIFVNICLVSKINHQRYDDKMKIIFFNLGDADAICVEFPHKQVLMVDTGGSYSYDAARSVILPYLWQEGIPRINALVLSHPHYDHLGGVFGLMNNIKIDYIFENGQGIEQGFYQDYAGIVKKKKIKQYTLCAGDTISGFKDARIEVLHPTNEFIAKKLDLNNTSLVLKISYKNFSMILPGDIMQQAMDYILANARPGELRAMVYKAPHHGKEVKSAAKFEQQIRPKAIVLTQKSRSAIYPEVKRIFSTAEYGAVVITTDGNDFDIKTVFPRREIQ